MTNLALVGDIGGTNSRFGLLKQGTRAIHDVEALKNDNFSGLEAALSHYLSQRGITSLAAAAVAVAAPVDRDVIALTNRDWSFTVASLAKTSNTKNFRLLNDYEALAMSLPFLEGDDVVQIGGNALKSNHVKIVLGPGTGLGMATLAPLPQGGWMALPGELGHITLPVVTQAEFDWREAMSKHDQPFESEDALTGGGLLLMYKTIANPARHTTPEQVLQAALKGDDADAKRTLDQFIIWLARISGDAAMTMQAHGGVYLAGGIAPSIVRQIQYGPFRDIFQEKGKLAHVMRPIPVYIIVDRFPALKGCAAGLPW